MSAQINDLVAMGDVETLYELMAEDDDWMIQLDAAEGLVKLGDMRGLEFLRSAQQSEERDIRQVAREILSDPVIQAKRAELEAASNRALREKKQSAIKRLQSGRKVFQYKMVYLAAGEILDDDAMRDDVEVPALIEYGLDGWEVVSIVARHRQPMGDAAVDMFGAYFLLKRELSAADTAELER